MKKMQDNLKERERSSKRISFILQPLRAGSGRGGKVGSRGWPGGGSSTMRKPFHLPPHGSYI